MLVHMIGNSHRNRKNWASFKTIFYGFMVHYIFKSTCVSYCENELSMHVLTLFLGWYFLRIDPNLHFCRRESYIVYYMYYSRVSLAIGPHWTTISCFNLSRWPGSIHIEKALSSLFLFQEEGEVLDRSIIDIFMKLVHSTSVILLFIIPMK